MNYADVATELLTALRGRRSQLAWSRRLGYRSNVAYTWESGRRSPTGAELFRAAARAGRDLRAGLERFYGQAPPWLLDGVDLTSPEAVVHLLRDLRGDTSISDLARRTGQSRFSLTRWLSGATQPRLPDLLQLIEATSVRLVDFVEIFVDPASLPSLAERWARVKARRRGAYQLPWTQAVLRALELRQYQALPAHEPGWIAARLGLRAEDEAECLEFLRATQQVVWDGLHFRPEVLAVDTRREPEVGRRLKAHWSRVAAARVEVGAPGQFSYNVFSVSRADLERIRELHLSYFHGLRAIVASSEPAECVVVANVQLLELGTGV